jgi:hypothetical protein
MLQFAKFALCNAMLSKELNWETLPMLLLCCLDYEDDDDGGWPTTAVSSFVSVFHYLP